MIPRTVGDLDEMVTEGGRQLTELDGLLEPLSERELLWRPNERKWSALGHVAHLCLLNERYLSVIEASVEDVRAAEGPCSDGPYKHPFVARWFVSTLEPPPRRRVRTMASMVPDPATESGDVLPRFRSAQGELLRLMRAARGYDLGRIRFSSPFVSILRLSLGTAFAGLLAHNRRHVWLIREVLCWDGFPGGSRGRQR